jgi:hypothetical protein
MLYAIGRLLIRHHRAVVLILLGATVAAGTAYVIWVGDVIRFPDEGLYLTLAKHLAFAHQFSADGKTPTTMFSPGWPFFLAPWVRLGLNVTGLHLVTMLLFVASVGLLWRFMAHAAGPLAGTLTVVLLLAYPVLFFTSTTLYSQTFGAFLFLLGLLLIAVPGPRGVWVYAVAGLVFGWAILTIPMFLPSVMVVAAWRLWPVSRSTIARSATLLAVVGVVVSLWIGRNYVHTGRFTFIASYAESVFLAGNSAVASASAGGNTDLSSFTRNASRLSEAEQRQYFREEAWRWLTGHPGQAIRLYFSKLLYWFSPTNRLVQADQQTAARQLVMILTYCPLLLLFVVRLLKFRRYPLQSWELLFYLVYLQAALSYAVFFPRIRYRLPYDYLLIAVVGGYLATAWGLYRRRVEGLPGRSP